MGINKKVIKIYRKIIWNFVDIVNLIGKFNINLIILDIYDNLITNLFFIFFVPYFYSKNIVIVTSFLIFQRIYY
jgi:hypothetical protein